MVCASQIFLERSYHIPEETILQKKHRENVKHLYDSDFKIVSYPMQAPSSLFVGTAHTVATISKLYGNSKSKCERTGMCTDPCLYTLDLNSLPWAEPCFIVVS